MRRRALLAALPLKVAECGGRRFVRPSRVPTLCTPGPFRPFAAANRHHIDRGSRNHGRQLLDITWREGLPELFAGQSEHAVEQDGAQVATITVLEPGGYLADLPQFDTQQCCSVLEGAAPPGMTVSNETVAGDPVVQGELDGATFWVWTREGYWNVVTAADPTAGKAFVKAYISAEHTTAA